MNHHAGIKPYQCEKCKACFSQSSNMKTHFRKCTGNGFDKNSGVIAANTGINPAGVPIPKEKGPGRPPKLAKPQLPVPVDHVSVIAHTNNTPYNEAPYTIPELDMLNRRRSNPCIGQRNFYESHIQQQLLQQQQFEDSQYVRKHSSSFSGTCPSASARNAARQALYQREQRFMSMSRDTIDLNNAIRFSLSRVESSPLARYGQQQQLRHATGAPIYMDQPTNLVPSPPQQILRTSPSGTTYVAHQQRPPSPTGEILRNSLLSKMQSSHPYKSSYVENGEPNSLDKNLEDAETPIITVKQEIFE